MQDFINNRLIELQEAKNILDEREKSMKLKICLKESHATMCFFSHVSEPFKFSIVENYEYKNVLFLGCIGDGKSSLLNKLNYLCDESMETLKEIFVTASNT